VVGPHFHAGLVTDEIRSAFRQLVASGEVHRLLGHGGGVGAARSRLLARMAPSISAAPKSDRGKNVGQARIPDAVGRTEFGRPPFAGVVCVVE
jgi:hypothetical protein